MPKGDIVEYIVFIDVKGVHEWHVKNVVVIDVKGFNECQRNNQGYDDMTNSVKDKGSDGMAWMMIWDMMTWHGMDDDMRYNDMEDMMAWHGMDDDMRYNDMEDMMAWHSWGCDMKLKSLLHYDIILDRYGRLVKIRKLTKYGINSQNWFKRVQ